MLRLQKLVVKKYFTEYREAKTTIHLKQNINALRATYYKCLHKHYIN